MQPVSDSTPPGSPLPDGLVLRSAVPRDLDQIAALLTDRGESEDAIDHRLVVTDPDAGWATCAVVVDGERVVSTATLLDETLVLGGVPIPAGQVELVATDRAYEGRGLVRALMGWAHRRSAELGQVAQVMIGIPYFYRQFGYAYAVPIAKARPVIAPPPPVDAEVPRIATVADIGAMARLQDAEQAGADLRMPHSPACWRWLVAREGSVQWLVERAGTPVAVGRISVSDEGVHLAEPAAVDPPAAYALLRHAVELARGNEVTVTGRSGTVAGGALGPFLGEPSVGAECYYARVADPAGLVAHLRPVLSARLAAAGFDEDGAALVSFFRTHIRFPITGGRVGPVTAGGTMQAPAAAGGAAVAPDLVAPLLFGPDGIDGLAKRHPDVYPGPDADLMRVLFPPVHADILTFYLT
jgi:predicted N-acetyltransferase YhbS